jgi:hypothetical protein
MHWALIVSGLTLSGVAGTAVFGTMLGGLYRWRIGEDGAAKLWVAGLGFIIVMVVAATGLFSREPFAIEYAAVRALYWTWLCVMMGVGRRLRIRIEEIRLTRKRQRFNEAGES